LVRTREYRDRYVDNFYESEGIRLDKEAIRPNAAKRGLAKLSLNNMFGKVTERKNRTKTKMISNPHKLYRFLAMSGNKVANMTFPSDGIVWASWCFIAEDKIRSLRHTNKVIGVYLTAGARLQL